MNWHFTTITSILQFIDHILLTEYVKVMWNILHNPTTNHGMRLTAWSFIANYCWWLLTHHSSFLITFRVSYICPRLRSYGFPSIFRYLCKRLLLVQLAFQTCVEMFHFILMWVHVWLTHQIVSYTKNWTCRELLIQKDHVGEP